MAGESFSLPGFCPGLRIKDYSCFLWATLPETPFNDSFEDLEFEGFFEEPIEQTISSICYTYLLPFVAVIGIFSNLLLLITSSNLCDIVSPTYIYLITTCPMDIGVIIVRIVNEWVTTTFYLDINVLVLVKADLSCKIYPLIFNFFFYLGRWAFVLAVLDCAIRSRRKIPPANTVDGCKAVVHLLIVIFIFINAHYFWSFELFVNRSRTQFICHFSNAYTVRQHISNFPDIIWPLIDFSIGDVIPLIMILAGTIINLYGRLTRWDKPLTDYKFSTRPIGVYELQGSLIALGFAYIFLITPKAFYSVYKYYVEYYNSQKYDSAILFHSLTMIGEGIFYGIKFLLMIITSGVFRATFRQMAVVTTFLKFFRQCKNMRPQKKEEQALLNPESAVKRCQAHKVHPNFELIAC